MSDPLALSGLKVLDFTMNLPGPYCTFILASMGADVIKIEPPKGDPARHMGSLFDVLNGGKKSVVLDLRSDEDRAHLKELVQWADVLVEGFRPGVMGRLGCDWETARAWNPTLIYCAISAFGQEGPRRLEPGHDLNLQALSGICHVERVSDQRPRGNVLPVADLSTSLVAVSAICAALHARRTPDAPGRYLDVAMSDAALGWTDLWGEGLDLGKQAKQQLPAGLATRLAGPFLRRLDRLKLFAMPQYGLYECRDGRYLALGIVDESSFWRSLCAAFNLPLLAKLPLPARTALGPVIKRLFARKFKRRTRAEWLTTMTAAGIPVTPVHTVQQAKSDPQYTARGVVDAQGRVRSPIPGSRFQTGAAPSLGEHTAQVLTPSFSAGLRE